MKFVAKSLASEQKEKEFRERHGGCLILGGDHEGVTELYSIEPESKEVDFAVLVAIAVTAVKPRVEWSEELRGLYVGFDTFVAAVPVLDPSKRKVFQLDGVFVDMFLLGDEGLCVIHELGALALTTDLVKLWSVTTDIIASWELDRAVGRLSLTEADSGSVVCVNICSGKTVPIRGSTDG